MIKTHRTIAFIFVCFIFLNACTSVKKYNARVDRLHAPEALKEDLDYTYTKFKQLHPNLYQYIPKTALDAKFDSLKRRITEPMTSKEFYNGLSQVVSTIGQGHISSNYPHKRFTRKERKARKDQKLDFYELDFKYLDDGLWIARTSKKDSALLGSKVMEIDGKPIASVIEAYKNTFSSDGYNTTFQNQFIGLRFPRFYTKHQGYLDSVSLRLQNQDSVYTQWFKRYDKTKKDAAARNIKDTTAVSKSPKLTKIQKKEQRIAHRAKKKRNKKYGYIASRDRFTRNFKFLDTAKQIGYFKIRSWGNGSYKKFYKESFQELNTAQAQVLLLDLRDNTGGRLAEIQEFYSYLVAKEFKFVAPAYTKTRLPYIKDFYGRNSNVLSVLAETLSVPFLTVHNLLKTRKEADKLRFYYSYAKTKKPAPFNFKGKIYVLINGNSFSASSLLSTNLKATQRAVFVGEETGGAYNGTVAGFYKSITLPNSRVGIRFGLMQIETPYKQDPDGFGVLPDIAIAPKKEDLYNGSDTELEWILNDIEKTSDKKNYK